jgi:hypothetical protein
MPSFYGMLARMMVVSQSFVPAKRSYLAAELPRFSNALATASAIHVITIHLISICITSEICHDILCIPRGEARAVGLLDGAGVAACWDPGTVRKANEERLLAHVVR